jgi:hypothetical protein
VIRLNFIYDKQQTVRKSHLKVKEFRNLHNWIWDEQDLLKWLRSNSQFRGVTAHKTLTKHKIDITHKIRRMSAAARDHKHTNTFHSTAVSLPHSPFIPSRSKSAWHFLLLCKLTCAQNTFHEPVAYPGFFSGDSTNSAEDRGQTERGSGCSSPLVRGFTQFANERNSYSD